jgi:RNA recognition motif-containing protein
MMVSASGPMMPTGQPAMMMPWAAMMGAPSMMADPSMMMWGPWGGMPGMMPSMVNEVESLPQAQREIIKLSNAVLHPPAPNNFVPNTRERPPGCKTIFVGGLPENTTEEMLQEMFANCGTICSLRLSKKNFAHIRFTSMDAVDKALYFSGYRMKIEDKDDKPNSGRIHVDFAQARDDLHEWETLQRQLHRETRQRERLEERLNRAPSPPTIAHFSDHEALALIESLKASETFSQGAQTLITWLERGDCNRRTSSVFYTLIQNTNGHVKRLMAEKNECNEELEQMKIKFQLRLETIVNQYSESSTTGGISTESW